MPPPIAIPPRDVEDTSVALTRVQADIDSQDPDDLSAYNVNVVEATSVVLGVCDGIMVFRDDCLKLPDFDIANLDKLSDYAKATWLLHMANLPDPEPADVEPMIEEVRQLREKLLRWASPLAEEGYLSADAVARLKARTGAKNEASAVVGLVAMFRAAWDSVKDLCPVTEAELDRGAKIAPAVFIWASRRDNDPTAPAASDANLRLKKAWTRVDRAYDQCRRALTYIRWAHGDVDVIAPSLRSNPGPRQKKPQQTPPLVADPAAPQQPAGPGETPIGGGEMPFV